MFYQMLNQIIQDNRLATLYLVNGQSFKIYNDKNEPYIAHIGEQYISVRYETHITLYPFSSILKIEIW